MPHILVVEDDPALRSRSAGARRPGVRHQSAPPAWPASPPPLTAGPTSVVLDLGLPDIDGGEFLRMFRAVSALPVIVATARDDEQPIVRALDAGADDYLTKPFGAAQLDARIRAVLRRRRGGDGRAPRSPSAAW